MQEFRKFIELLDKILQFSAEYWGFEAFSSMFAKLRQKFITIWPKNSQIHMKNRKIWMNKTKFIFIFAKKLDDFSWNFEIWAVQKYVHLVDLVKNFPTNIYLQIWRRYSRERASLSLEKMNKLFNPLLTHDGHCGLPSASYLQPSAPSAHRRLAWTWGLGASWRCVPGGCASRTGSQPSVSARTSAAS